MRHITIGRPPALLHDFLSCYPSHQRPSLSDILELLVKDDYTRPTTTSSYSSIIRRRRRRLTRLPRWGEQLAC